MTIELIQIIDPADWREIEQRAFTIAEAAGQLAYAVRMAAHEPGPFRENHVRIMRANCQTAGMTETEIENIIRNTREDMLDGR